jgi:hypothetical protein
MANSERKKPSRSPRGSRPRILRIGVLLGDTFIEERLIRERKSVTVGQSGRNTFSVPIEGLPRSWPLFALEGRGYTLRFTDKMDGRVAIDGKPRSLESLKGHEARRADSHWSLPLDEGSRGKVEIGEMRLLFQFVAAPPLQPRPRLPASVRGTLADRIDARLAVILAASIMLHFVVALIAYNHDQTKDRYAEKRLKDFRRDTFEERTITFDNPVAATEEADAEAGDQGEPEAEPEVTRRPAPDDSGGGSSDDVAPDDAAVDEAIKNAAIMGILGAGEGAEGRYSKTADVDQGAGLDKGIEDIKRSGKGVSGRGNPGDRRARGPSTGKLGGDKSGGNVEEVEGGGGTSAKKEEKIASRASFGSVDDLSLSTLDPSDVIRRIRSRYLRGIKLCHERVLKVNPRSGGKVALRFTVGPTGRVTSASARGFDPTVDSCIKQQMNRWRFGTPKDDGGKPMSADFATAVVLKPGG